MVGIVEEQHPDRARLFMQWTQMDFPILVDSYDRYRVPVVPITLLLDEYGVIRGLVSPGQPPPDLEAFLGETFAPPEMNAPFMRPTEVALTPTEMIAGLQKGVSDDPDDGYARFRLGVVYRMRHDSPARADDDFQAAIDAWTDALRIDPNNYIWRRRIQQYGPRLDKPYPFYDWVEQARDEITARGETPVPLVVEPAGSELAGRTARLEPAAAEDPDPTGKVTRDDRFVALEVTAVPGVIAPGEPARLHVVMRPRRDGKAHWNNEAGPTQVWLAPPPEWTSDGPLRSVPVPPDRASTETRRAEFELASPDGFEGSVEFPGHAVYYVCEDVTGTCLFRRQDFTARLVVAPP